MLYNTTQVNPLKNLLKPTAMQVKHFFGNPNTEFLFINTEFVLKNIFNKPFPVDRFNENKGVLNLSHYFEIKKLIFQTKNGVKNRKSIVAQKSFHVAYKNEKATAFMALCGFMLHFNLPMRNFVMQVKKHEEVPPNPKLSPLAVYYKKPAFPLIDEEKGGIMILLEQNFYSEIIHYQTGRPIEVPPKPMPVRFPFSTFCGLSLNIECSDSHK